MKTAHWKVARFIWVGLAAAALALASCAKEMTLPLEWRPNTPAAEMQKQMGKVDLAGAKVQFAKLEDTRKQPTVIGKQPDDKEPKTVSTRDDVGAFVAKQLGASIAQLTPGSGLLVTDKEPSVAVSGKVVDFFVTEVRGTYEGEVRLALQVKKADGTLLYEVNTNGKSSRFAPIPFKGENYQEAYSDALLQVAKSLVEDAKFCTALRGTKP
ncbi:MAG TPA: hypothetical protein VF678_16560 [bacterium]